MPTRSPSPGPGPGNKNDGAHVEQKNWARVRELVGYLRYDTAAELEKLNEIWELDRIFTNYLLPQQKLIGKHRHGAKVTKKHDAPATPAPARDPARDGCRKRPVIRMNAAFKRIKPGALSRQILALTGELETLALAKKTAPPVKPPVTNRSLATHRPSTGGFQMRQRITLPGGIAMRQQGVRVTSTGHSRSSGRPHTPSSLPTDFNASRSLRSTIRSVSTLTCNRSRLGVRSSKWAIIAAAIPSGDELRYSVGTSGGEYRPADRGRTIDGGIPVRKCRTYLQLSKTPTQLPPKGAE